MPITAETYISTPYETPELRTSCKVPWFLHVLRGWRASTGSVKLKRAVFNAKQITNLDIVGSNLTT